MLLQYTLCPKKVVHQTVTHGDNFCQFLVADIQYSFTRIKLPRPYPQFTLWKMVIRWYSQNLHRSRRIWVLGVWVTRDLKPSEQCIQSARKAQALLGMAKRQFKEIDREDFGIVYNTHVRPHLEYCVQAWSPHLQKDKACLERVQRLATRMVKGLKKFTYETRLKRLGIYSLERRRLRGDLIETFNILTGRERIDSRQILRTVRNYKWTTRSLSEIIHAKMLHNC